ncbi:MAG: DUF1957 domain-containing protein [Candidatus Omnitrophica bacterium]|nr:DUF1957 domain-containing protein [Candidatus Omnitrophota bacterium]
MAKGYLAFVLHAHLPYVRHPEYDTFLEERWYFEACTETYIPIIKFFNELNRDAVPFKVTISVSPSLLAMMADPLLQDRYQKHLENLIELSEKELERTKHEPHFHWLAGMYRTLFIEAHDIYVHQYQKNLTLAFKDLHHKGCIDLITTSATHGLLPLLAPQPNAVEAQVITGLNYFESVLGFRPSGMWLPECGYFSGLDKILKKEGIRFFIMEGHGLDHATTTPFYGVHAPLFTPSGVAAFGRDQLITKQVWSAEEGFPGHPDYREFYRDIGHELDFHYIQPYIAGDVRTDTGMKYFRITGNAWKEPYNPNHARDRAAEHAAEFLFSRKAHIEAMDDKMENHPIIVAPFDAELFGHWWFEGPQWLNYVIKKAAFEQETIELISLTEYLDQHPVHQKGVPASSTWGYKGYFEGWLNDRTDWIYPQLYECCQRMESLAQRFGKKEIPEITQRALNQCVRELLLAQSSDWPFIINNGTATEYATRRIKDHVGRFHYLANSIVGNDINNEYLSGIEFMDNIFPDVNFKVYLGKGSPIKANS